MRIPVIYSAAAFVLPVINISVVLAAPAPIITSTFDKNASGDYAPGFGITTSVAKRPFVGVENQQTSLPYISLRLGDFYIEGLDAGYNLAVAHGFRLDLLATPRFYERKASFASNGELAGIEQTRETVFAGVSAQFHTDYGALTLQALYDVIESDGLEFVAQASSTFDLNRDFKFTPSFGISVQNASLVDHFYGVATTEVNGTRAAYDGTTSVNYNITLNVSYQWFDHVELLGQVKYEGLGDGITDSSVVDEDSVYFATAGAVYRF